MPQFTIKTPSGVWAGVVGAPSAIDANEIASKNFKTPGPFIVEDTEKEPQTRTQVDICRVNGQP